MEEVPHGAPAPPAELSSDAHEPTGIDVPSDIRSGPDVENQSQP